MNKLTKKTIEEFSTVVRASEDMVEVTRPYWDILGGNTSPNLLPVPVSFEEDQEVLDIEKMSSTSMDPNCKYLKLNGEILPSPFYLGMYQIVELFKENKEGEIIPLGLFFDLSPYASALNSVVLGTMSMDSLKIHALSELQREWTSSIRGNHHGMVARGVAHVRPDLPEDHLAIDRCMAEKIAELKQISIDEVNGLMLASTRFPIVDNESTKIVVLRVCKTAIQHFGVHPKAINGQGGDNDGDTLNLHDLKEILGTVKGLGWVDYVSIPRQFGKLTLSLSDLPVRTYGSDLSVSIGLGSKNLQGLVTNLFERLALIGTITLTSDVYKHKREGLLSEMGIIEEELNNMLPLNVSILVQKAVKSSGLAAMTEVIMDRRKYVEGDPERFDDAIASIINISMGKTTEVNLGALERVSKDGKTVNAKLIQSILSISGSPVLFMKLCPVSNCLVGKMNPDKTAGLAKAIKETSVADVLRIASGFDVEDPLELEVKAGKGSKVNRWIRQNGDRPEYKGAIHQLGELLWFYNTTKVVVRLLPVTKYRMRVMFTFEGMEGKQAITASFKNIKPELYEGEIGGYLVTVGNTRQYARHIIQCKNVYAGMMASSQKQVEFGIQGGDIEMVTILDKLAQSIVSVAEAIEDFIDAGVSPSEIEIKTRVRNAVQKVLEKFARHLGVDETDTDMYREAHIYPWEASVDIPEGSNPWSNLLIYERMMTLISNMSFPNPINKRSHKFSVGVTSKSSPGTVVTALTWYGSDKKRTMIEEASFPWSVNTDRERREARTNRMAKVLLSPDHIIEGPNDNQEIHDRSTDLVIAFVNGDGWLKSGQYNPDASFMTRQGFTKTKSKTEYRKIGPISMDVLVDMIPDLPVLNKDGDMVSGYPYTYEEFIEFSGWKVDKIHRETGQYDGIPVFSTLYTLTSPSKLPQSKWKKLGFQGHKTVALPINDSVWTKVEGEKIYVDVFIDIDTITSKKMEDNLLYGLAALLGYETFSGSETRDDMLEYIKSKTKKEHFPLYHGPHGKKIGECIVGLFRTFVLKEDEKISTSFHSNGMSWNPCFSRLMGEPITIHPIDAKKMQILADYCAE